jgi:hypothetical protein
MIDEGGKEDVEFLKSRGKEAQHLRNDEVVQIEMLSVLW